MARDATKITDREIAWTIDRYEDECHVDPIPEGRPALQALAALIGHWPEFLFVRDGNAYRWDGRRLHVHGYNNLDHEESEAYQMTKRDWPGSPGLKPVRGGLVHRKAE